MSVGIPLRADEIAEIRRLRYEERLSQREVGEAMGLCRRTVWEYAPGGTPGVHPANIDNAPLRAAFLASGRTASDVAKAIGWTQLTAASESPTGTRWARADESRLKRTLGITPESSRGRRFRRQTINPANALLIGTELGLDPHEIGL